MPENIQNTEKTLKRRIFDIIQIGDKSNIISRGFDIFIVIVILSNILVMFLDTFSELQAFHPLFRMIELVTTGIFCIEYALRIWTADELYPARGKAQARMKFLVSFDGIVDLLTIVPAFFLTGFVVFRMLRVVRIFHLFRINTKYDSFHVIASVLLNKKNQILSSVFIIIIMMFASSLCMYSAEHEAQPEVFENAFSGLWWAMSTLLTVGYGDIYPITTLGRFMAIIIAFLGVGVVAIPTGIISAGFVEQYSRFKNLDQFASEEPIGFVTVRITEKHNWKDVYVRETNLPQGLLMVVIIRGDDIVVPSGDMKLLVGDVVILCAEVYEDQLDLRLKEVYIEAEHSWVGKTVKNLDISRLSTIVMIRRGRKIVVPHGNTLIKEKDRLMIYNKS